MKSHLKTKHIKKLIKNEFGWAQFVALAVIVVVAVGITGYFMFKSNNTKKTTNSITPSTTTKTETPATSTQSIISETWPIYTDKYDGYTVQYPTGWFVQSVTRQFGSLSLSNFDRSTQTKDALPDSQYIINIYSERNANLLTLQQVVDQQDKDEAEGYVMDITNQKTITNSSGVTLITRESYNETMHTGAYEAYAVNGDKFYIITSGNNTNVKRNFDAVVNSFKLIQ